MSEYNVFDKIAGASEGTITYKDVVSNLNLLDYDYYFRMTDALWREDSADAFLILEDIGSAIWARKPRCAF